MKRALPFPSASAGSTAAGASITSMTAIPCRYLDRRRQGTLSHPRARGGSSSLGGRGGRQDVVLEALAQRGLLDLAGSGMRDLVDHDHVVGHPPLRDLALQEAEQLVLGRGLVLLEHDDEQRTLVP